MDYSKIRPKKRCGNILYFFDGICVGRFDKTKNHRGRRKHTRKQFEKNLEKSLETLK